MAGPHIWRTCRLIETCACAGDGRPPDFKVDDCATQRNLSDEGRAQARRIGARFRANGIETAKVFSSQWCRCRETAELLEVSPRTVDSDWKFARAWLQKEIESP